MFLDTNVMRVKTEQVETLLKTQEPEQQQRRPSPANNASSQSFPSTSAPTSTNFIIESNLNSMNDYALPTETSMGGMATDYGADGMNFDHPGMSAVPAEAYPWEMIGLGLDEPLPPQDTIDDLYVQILPRMEIKELTKSTDIEYTSKKSIRHVQSYTDHASSHL